MLFWLLCTLIFAYFFYTRIWLVYNKISYYRKQGVPFHSGIYPVLGSYLNLMQFTKSPQPDDGSGTSLVDFIKETYYKDKTAKVPPIVGMVFGSSVTLVVCRPEPAEELFLTKNKYFDKHPRSAKFFSRLTGDSILFAKSDLLWQQKRKSLSAALYKDKLRVMIEMMKDVTLDVIRNKWMKAEGKKIDIVKESSNLFIKITLKCLFGGDNSDIKII
jgi:cytochrome P450